MTKRPDAYVEHLSDDAWPDSALQEAARIQRAMSAHKRPRATDEREAVARAICAADFERGDGSPEDVARQRAVDYNETFNYFNYADAALSALAPIRAAEILAARTSGRNDATKAYLEGVEHGETAGEANERERLLSVAAIEAAREYLALCGHEPISDIFIKEAIKAAIKAADALRNEHGAGK